MSEAAVPGPAADEIKSCCAQVYASTWARILLGDSLHPGGLRLSERLAQLLHLDAGGRVLDVAAGRGESAIHIAETTGCHVVGVELSHASVAEARERARDARVDDRVRFVVGDAERLEFDDAFFDAVLCECAFCIFPDKGRAASEFARVLRPGGRLGMSDLTRAGALPEALHGLLGWVACIADAQPVQVYADHLVAAGLYVDAVEHHDDALRELIESVQQRLVGVGLLASTGGLGVQPADVVQARSLALAAREAVTDRRLGYAIVCASKPIRTLGLV